VRIPQHADNRKKLTNALSSVAGCTIVAKSYLSYARVLARSFCRFHPDLPFFVLLADEVDGYFDPADEPFQMLGLSELGIPRLERLRFHYMQQPLSYAATPYLLAHVLAGGFERAIFFKQESLVLGSLSPIVDLLARHPVVMTPHLLAPLSGADRIARELNILQSGAFNVGLLGVARTSTTERFLAWWQDRVRTYCRHDVAGGMHYEQRWLDLVPGFFEDVCILRDPSCNVAHWNLPDRSVTVAGGQVLVEGQSCTLFRFSGYEPDSPKVPTKYSGRLTWENIGPARQVFDRFRVGLEEAGYHTTKSWPYAYGFFDNGVPVPDVARSIYLGLGEDVERFGDPLRSASRESYFSWLSESTDSEQGSLRVPRLWYGIHQSRPDLRTAFPDPLGTDRSAFLSWIACSGLTEYRHAHRFAPDRVALS
jgi:hypothetical protein